MMRKTRSFFSTFFLLLLMILEHFFSHCSSDYVDTPSQPYVPSAIVSANAAGQVV